MGSAEYVEAQRRLIGLGTDGFLSDISAKTHADIDEWQTQMQVKPMRAGRVHLYSGGLPAEARCLTGVHMLDSLEAAIDQSLRDTGDPHVAVIPEGPYVVPVYQTAG
jgi:hypothetical protein